MKILDAFRQIISEVSEKMSCEQYKKLFTLAHTFPRDYDGTYWPLDLVYIR